MNISSIQSKLPFPDKKDGIAAKGEGGFQDIFKQAIQDVNKDQVSAHQSMQALSSGQTSNIHETMISIQKAEISFKMLMQVRNKIVTAYQEIMRMQV